MKILRDFEGRRIRLTSERLAHILEHPEMRDLIERIADVLEMPERVVESRVDPEARLYYRYFFETVVGGKYLCIVVKNRGADSFVLTA